jgi:uncharacterized ion transporter superfamily protein YfcC
MLSIDLQDYLPPSIGQLLVVVNSSSPLQKLMMRLVDNSSSRRLLVSIVSLVFNMYRTTFAFTEDVLA